MSNQQLGNSLDDIFAELAEDVEFRKADRRAKPYYDLVLQIIKRRKELGLTQKELAARAGTHQSRVSKIESAEYDIRLSTLIDIAEALETEVCIYLDPIEGMNVRENEKYKELFKTVNTAQGVQNFAVSTKESISAELVFD